MPIRSGMNRRELLYSIIAVAVISVMPNTQAFNSNIDQIVPVKKFRRKKKIKTLRNGEVYSTEEDTLIELPFRPKDNDHVHIIVRNSSVIEYYENCILGKPEPLRLDTLAIIKLTYNSDSNNWHLS